MGRRILNADYQVKNTFVTLNPDEETEFSRSSRALSANDASGYNPGIQMAQDDKPGYMAQTPSPFLHPAAAPENALMHMPQLNMPGYDLPQAGAIAFGDIPADFDLNCFNEGGQGNYSQAMMYDPTSGMYMAYDWQMQYNQGCYPMMGDMQAGIGEDFNQQIGNCMQMPSSGVNGGQTDHLMAALSEKLAASKGAPYDENGIPVPEAMGEPYDPDAHWSSNQAIESWEDQGASTIGAGAQEHEQRHGERGGRKNRNERHREKLRGDRADRGDYSERNEYAERNDSSDRAAAAKAEATANQGPVNYTTVMFRNIPNKYTREMLVNELEQELKGMFDFVYLPIDFKNKCNVGYAFINFRSLEACECFLLNFNGVEVRKCLPGLNSRKVTEVTPARVQGFEENVQRLRNSPVMRELAQHQEWMPLIFDENGENTPFPAPERVLEHIKPRRRGRDEGGRD